MEKKFTSGDVRDAWKSLNTMMGRTQDAAKIQCPDPVAFAEELNTFYARFNSTDSVEDGVTYNYPSESICVEEKRVVSILTSSSLQKHPDQTG